MQRIHRFLGLVVCLILGPIFSVLRAIQSALDLPTFHEKRSIILRKVRGVSGGAALFRTDRGASGIGGGSMVSAMAFGLALVLMTLAISGTAFAIGLRHADPSAVATMTHSAPLFAIGNVAVKLKAKEDELTTKQKALHKVFEEAGTDVDFAKPAVLTLVGAKSSAEAVEKVNQMDRELTALGKERDEIANLKAIEERTRRFATEPVDNPPNPDGSSGEDDVTTRRRMKSIGQAITSMELFKKAKNRSQGNIGEFFPDFGLKELKATFLTSAGWAPESLRTGLVVDKATRPIQVLDIIPEATTDMAAVKYMEETIRTDAGAERAENASYAESAYALTERTEAVRSIGESVPVTDEQLEDVAGSQSYLEQRLGFGVRQRLDGQVVIGDGNAPNLTGIKNKAGIQTQAKGADPSPDAIYKAMVLVRVTGRAFPNAAIIHPTNWQAIRLLRTADGIYIWGSPSDAGIDRIWGIQVVQSDADAAGTAYVGDYANFCALYNRKGLDVAVGYVNNDFLQGRRTIRAGLRVAFAIYRAAAFCSVTGLP